MSKSLAVLVPALLAAALPGCSTLMPGTGAPDTPALRLEGTSWKILQINDVRLTADQARATSASFSKGQASFNAGCNRMGGGYKVNGSTISFGQMISTLIGCPPPLAGFEREIGALLETPVEASMGNDGTLWLKGDRTRQLLLKSAD